MTKLAYLFRSLFLVVGACIGFAVMYFIDMPGREDKSQQHAILGLSGRVALADGAAPPLSFSCMDGLMRRYGRMTSEEAARELEKVWSSPSLQKDGGAAVLLYYLAYRAGESAVTFLGPVAARGERKTGDLMLAALQGWADRDLPAATQFIQQNKKTYPYLLTVLTDTAKNRMETNFEEVEKWMETLDVESRPVVLARFLDEMAVLQPDKFFLYVEKVKPSDLHDFSLCGVIARRGAVIDWERTQKWVDVQPKHRRGYIRSVAWGGLATVDPEWAKREYERTKDMTFKKEDEVFKIFNPRFLISALSTHSPVRTLEWLKQIGFVNYSSMEQGRDVIRGLEKPEQGVEDYICQMPNSSFKDGVLMGLVDLKLDMLSYPDYPKELVPWVASIQEKGKRLDYMRKVLKRWGSYSPDEVRNFFVVKERFDALWRSGGSTDEVRNFFVGRLKHFSGISRDLYFYSGLPEERDDKPQGKKREVFPIDSIRSPFGW